MLIVPLSPPYGTWLADYSSFVWPLQDTCQLFQWFSWPWLPKLSKIRWLWSEWDGASTFFLWRPLCKFGWACSSVYFNHKCSGVTGLFQLTYHNCGLNWEIEVKGPNPVCLELSLRELMLDTQAFTCTPITANILQNCCHPVFKTPSLWDSIGHTETAPAPMSSYLRCMTNPIHT